MALGFTAPDEPSSCRSVWQMVDAEERLAFPWAPGIRCQVLADLDGTSRATPIVLQDVKGFRHTLEAPATWAKLGALHPGPTAEPGGTTS